MPAHTADYVADLFDARRYPHRAGSKESAGTSRDAARAIERTGKAETIRQKVLQALGQHPAGLLADEVAQHICESLLAVRPRLSELAGQGKIRKTKHRRPSPITAHPGAVYKLNGRS